MITYYRTQQGWYAPDRIQLVFDNWEANWDRKCERCIGLIDKISINSDLVVYKMLEIVFILFD